MSSDEEDYIANSVSMEIHIDEDGVVMFNGGWGFDDDCPQERVKFLQDILAGVYALVSTQPENVVAAGRIVRSAPGFDGFAPSDEEFDIIFEADEEFEEKVNGKDQNDLNIIKFDPKKHRKH
jgi:hypothetical protein